MATGWSGLLLLFSISVFRSLTLVLYTVQRQIELETLAGEKPRITSRYHQDSTHDQYMR
jgi:hypothetical protein